VGARSLEKADGAIAEMKKTSSTLSGSLYPIVVDLSDLKQVKAAAQKFVSTEARLDILVNNAGLLARPLDKDENGISVSMVTNHLGPMLFTLELLPLLKKTAAAHPGVRVVTVSSSTHAVPQGVKFSSLEDLNQTMGGTDDMQSNYGRYGLSKLANVLFAKELQRRFDAENVQAISITLHPGGVATDGAHKFVGDNKHLLEGAMTPEQGALTPLFAATKPEIWTEKDKYAGAYLMPYGVIQPVSETAQDPELAKQLWSTSELVINQVLSK